MMNLSSLYTGCLLLLLTACASSQDRYLPVFHAQPRVSTLGFTVSPPPGTGWYEKVSDGSLYYLKKTEPEHYFIYTRATELHFDRSFENSDEFLTYVRSRKERNTRPEIYRNSRFKFQPAVINGRCIRYRQHYEDHSLESSRPGDQPRYANVSSSGLICIHPDQPRSGIELYYLERSLPGSPTISYADEGEEFLASLVFVPPQASL